MAKEESDPNIGRSRPERLKPPPYRPDRRLITYLGTSRTPEEVRAIIERDEAAAPDGMASENAT